MRPVLLLFILAGIVVGLYRYGSPLLERLPEPITSRLPLRQVPDDYIAQDAVSVDERVLGASTEVHPLVEKLQELMTLGGSVAQQAVHIVSTPPENDEEVIDVSKVAASVAQGVENIPSNIARQAKIEYCKQVLLQATASARPQEP